MSTGSGEVAGWAWEAQAFAGGWLRLKRRALVQGEVQSATDREEAVYLRLERNDQGALEVREAAMISGGPIDAATWRDVPFAFAGLMVTAPNGPPMPSGVSEEEWLRDGEGFTLADVFEGEYKPNGDGGGVVFIGPIASGNGKLAALKAPARNLTDEFLADLAGAYRELVAAKRNPAPAIADQTGAPVATVRRWVAVARRRGFLPPATQGRAG